jgi:cytochrome P450
MLVDPDLIPFEPPARPSFTALRRSLIEAFPRSSYEQGLTRVKTPLAEIFFVCDPDLIHELLIRQADAFRRDVMFVRTFRSLLGKTSLFVAEGEDWRRPRRAANATFRPETLLSLVSMIAAMAQREVARLRERPKGSPIEISAEMSRVTLEISVKALLGGEVSLDVHRFASALTDILNPTAWQMILALLSAPLWAPYPGSWRHARARAYLRGEIGRIVQERCAGTTGQLHLWDRFRAEREAETHRAMTHTELVDSLLSFIGAGLEAIGVALTWSLWLLAKDQEAQQRVYEEVRAVAGDESIEAAHMERLAFTKCVIQEALRLYPPAAAIFRQATRTTMLGSCRLKAGAHAIIPLFALHRNARLWENPNAFHPDRFYPDRANSHLLHAYMPFGAGPRTCIGALYAMIEATAVLATLVRAFKFRPVPGHKAKPVARVSLRPNGGIPLFVEPR